MDRLTKAHRSRIMAAVRGRDTTPEKIVRRLVHAMGFRFRLYRADMPGTPDLVLARHRTVILVHGCFWHAHTCRHGRREPKSNVAFWRAKRSRNRQRDREVRAVLRALGWRVVTVWQCQTKHPDRLRARLSDELQGVRRRGRSLHP
ncbi:MAG: very short patch repair endonuclease [Phycisphaerales bacterium]